MNSVLYPRLLDRAAADLHREYSSLPIGELTRRNALTHPSAVFTATGGGRVTPDHLRELRKRIVEAAEKAGFPDPQRKSRHQDFDRTVARMLHERCGLVAAEAAVRPMWAFLALVVLPDVSYWRYPNPPDDRVLATDITRHVWGRLWWRAHLLALPSVNGPYTLLDTFGEADFDQIFARRALLGGSRTLIQAFANLWPSLDKGGLPDRQVLRDVLKRLLRAAAVVEFDVLDPELMHDQIRWEASRSVVALWEERRAGGKGPA